MASSGFRFEWPKATGKPILDTLCGSRARRKIPARRGRGEAPAAPPRYCWLPCETREVSAAATSRRRPRRYRPDDPLEIGVRSGSAVDWHMLRDIELQPLDVAEQRD